MRRSICYCEPSVARAGQISTWTFIYTTSTSLPEGTRMKFDILSKGRGIDWEAPHTDLSEDGNVIYALLESGEVLEMEEVETPESIVPQYEFTLSEAVKTGHTVTIVMGALPESTSPPEETGTECQLMTQRRRPFNLYIDPKGKGNYDEPEVFTMDIRGNTLHTIRILAPSFVAKNKRFDITVRFEDEYGNLTNLAPEETLVELSYEHLRENLNWKLFVPETGFVTLPNLYFNEAGVYRIQLKNLHTKETFVSAPVKCFQENDRNLFWGLFHGESERFDSSENIESCLRHFRDERAFNFFASSNFDTVEETSNEVWKHISQNITDFNEEDRFVTMSGFQYEGEAGKEGIRQILYYKDQKPILRHKETKSSCLTKIYKTSTPKDLISIPSFTMGKGFNFNFKEFVPEYERVVEIYNAWGSSLETKKEGNHHPITGGLEEVADGSALAALKKNLRFGFVAGGLDDRGIYSDFYDSDQVQYSPGMAAVLCEKYTRESVMQALYHRKCYATTGARIIVGFYIAGHPMGSELTTAKKPGLAVNRHISGYVAGTDALETVEVLRNGEVIHTFHPTTYQMDYYHDDMEPIEKTTIAGGKDKPPFVFYYLRVTQKDGHIAWSSPIWIDIEKPTKAKKETA